MRQNWNDLTSNASSCTGWGVPKSKEAFEKELGYSGDADVEDFIPKTSEESEPEAVVTSSVDPCIFLCLGGLLFFF